MLYSLYRKEKDEYLHQPSEHHPPRAAVFTTNRTQAWTTRFVWVAKKIAAEDKRLTVITYEVPK